MRTGDVFNFKAFSPDGKGREIKSKARVHKELSINLISRSKAEATCIRFREIPRVRVVDPDGKVYETSSLIVLRWYEAGVPKTYDDDFYVVDKCSHDVILGASAPNQHSEPCSECHALDLEPQTEV